MKHTSCNALRAALLRSTTFERATDKDGSFIRAIFHDSVSAEPLVHGPWMRIESDAIIGLLGKMADTFRAERSRDR